MLMYVGQKLLHGRSFIGVGCYYTNIFQGLFPDVASINLCFLFGLCCVVCGILGPQPGIEHRPLAVKA